MSTAPHRRLLPVLLAVALAAAPVGRADAAASAGEVVGDGLVLDCHPPEEQTLRCNYRLTDFGQPLAASASVGGQELPPPAFAARTGAPGEVAVLLLVDTSDPGRAPALRKVIDHVGRLVDEGQLYQRFGLAAFDSELRMLAPVGSDPDTIKAAAATLQATGKTTELYRNVVQALKRLAAVRDPHKVLVVMSDGLAEDRAYFHADAVRQANRHRIAVYGIGYPRSVSLSVGLQSLRRLAEDTGGHFAATSSAFDLPESFFDAPFAAVENVGALSVDLEPVAQALGAGAHGLRIVLQTGAGPVSAIVPVELPGGSGAAPVVKVVEVEVPKVVEVEKVVEVPVSAPAPPAPAPASSEVPLWYWMAAIAMLALALLVLLAILLLQRRGGRRAATPTAAPPPALATLAYLQLAGTDADPAPITSATFRIGRLADNDLVLADASVSRHHAEIRRRRDGSFQVLDLDSMNGILVNGERVKESALRDGDRLEIGDVAMSFAVAAADDLPGEQTVMLKTVLPDQPFPEAVGGRR